MKKKKIIKRAESKLPHKTEQRGEFIKDNTEKE
jgi:hypothetical protein